MDVSGSSVVFFDASCLISAAISPGGGAAYVLTLCRSGMLRAAVSLGVLDEAERNILLKASAEARILHDMQLLAMPELIVAPLPAMETTQHHEPIFQEDAHVVGSALECGAQFLLTLDRPLRNWVEAQLAGSLRAYTPGDFINGVLPEHPDYDLFRGTRGG